MGRKIEATKEERSDVSSFLCAYSVATEPDVEMKMKVGATLHMGTILSHIPTEELGDFLILVGKAHNMEMGQITTHVGALNDTIRQFYKAHPKHDAQRTDEEKALSIAREEHVSDIVQWKYPEAGQQSLEGDNLARAIRKRLKSLSNGEIFPNTIKAKPSQN